MNLSKFEQELGVSNLKKHLVDEIKKARIEADILTNDIFKTALDRIEREAIKEYNSYIIINELIHLKKNIYLNETSEVYFYFKNYSYFKKNELNELNSNVDEDEKVVDFIIEYFTFLNLPFFVISNRFKNFKNDFKYYFLRYFYEQKSKLLFDELNRFNLLKDFTWNLENLDNGILKLYQLLIIEKEKSISDLQLENRYIKESSDIKIKSLEDEQKSLIREINLKEGTINYYEEYHRKYLENYPTLINETFFGDNQPFIFNLYNFLRKNLLINMMGWSYFYSCMSSNSNEIINLQSKNKAKFIGRIFYLLQDFLQPKYKSDFHDFLKNKFYFNEKPINNHFLKNHMLTTYDKSQYPNLNEVDEFFANQKNIYIKTNN